MEAGIWGNPVNVIFPDIRFVYNAVARMGHQDYDAIEAPGNPGEPMRLIRVK